MAEGSKDDDLARELATTPPVKQMDNLGAAVDAAEKDDRAKEGEGAGERGSAAPASEQPAKRKDGAGA